MSFGTEIPFRVKACMMFDPEYADSLKEDMAGFAGDILQNFTDENNVIHEIITAENEMFP